MFFRKPANNSSLARRKLLYNRGINDAPHTVKPTIGGRRYKCPYYSVWHSMFTRCYGISHIKDKAEVAAVWWRFSAFLAWAEAQGDISNKVLDKDIKVPYNKTYSPDTCLFIPPPINTLFSDHKAAKGKYPTGVHIQNGKYLARISVKGNRVFLGSFNTINEAETAYTEAKIEDILSRAEGSDGEIKEALLRWVSIYKNKLELLNV